MTPLKLLECIGNIDEAYIAELERAVSAPARKKPYKYASWLCAAAACLLCAAVGTHFIPVKDGIVTVTDTVTENIVTDSGSGTDTAAAVTAAQEMPAVPKTPPAPYHIPEGSGGDEMADFYEPVQPILESIYAELCRDMDMESWFKAKHEANPIPDNLSDDINMYSFIHDFGITRQEAEEAMAYYINSDDPQLKLSTEIFDLIYSENVSELGRQYAKAHTIAKGEKLYTPRWLYYHTTAEWTAAGITPDDVESRLHQYENIPFSPEGREYFGELISEFLGRRVFLDDPCADWEDKPVPVVEAVSEDIAEDVFDDIEEEIEETDIYP